MLPNRDACVVPWQMRLLEDSGTFSWQRLADEGSLCVVGKYVDPAVACVHATVV